MSVCLSSPFRSQNPELSYLRQATAPPPRMLLLRPLRERMLPLHTWDSAQSPAPRSGLPDHPGPPCQPPSPHPSHHVLASMPSASGAGWFCGGRHPVHCREFISIPDLRPWIPGPPLPGVTTETSPVITKCPLGTKCTPFPPL